MTEYDPDNLIDRAMYDVLSAAIGNDLKAQRLRELRQRRKKFIDRMVDDRPVLDKQIISTLVEMALEEVQFIQSFEPTLCIVTEQQYRVFVDASLSTPIWPDEAHHTMDKRGIAELQPPYLYVSGEQVIPVVFSNSVDSMVLVDGSKLSVTEEL